MVEPVDRGLYEDYEKLARERVLTREADDWPIVAVAKESRSMSFQSSDRFIANWSDGFGASTSRARRKIDALGWRKTRFHRAVAILTLLTGSDECPSHELRQTPRHERVL
jgi:hypothetical protein